MVRRSFIGWLLGALGVATTKRIVDTTTTVSGGYQENEFTARAAVEADNVKIKCGDLEISSPGGMGRDTTVKIDGKVVAVKSVKLEMDIRGCWNASFDYYPCIGIYGDKRFLNRE